MKSSPRVSVIVPCYNAEKFIRETVESVLEQTFTDFELIVLNDGSTDGTEKILQSFSDPRILLVNKPNSGVADTRNQGIAKSRGEFVAFLDADDAFEKDNLSRKVEYLDANPEVGLLHSEINFFNEKGIVGPFGRNGCQGSVLVPLLEFKVMVNSPSSAVIRKSLLVKVGGFDSRLSTSADRDLWIRLAAETAFGYLPDPLVRYRLHAGQMHHNIDAMERDLKVIYEKLRGGNYFSGKAHYHHCRAIAERIIAGSYFRHTWQYHKFAKHVVLSGAHGFARFFA